MNFLRSLLFTSFLSILIISCRDEKDKSIGATIYSFRKGDTLFLKIQNKSQNDIWIPYEYLVNYSDNDDSIYLERNIKEKFATTKYFLYKNILGSSFYTKRELLGISYDSLVSIRRQVDYFNQFHLRDLVKLKPDSNYLMTITFNFPDDGSYIKAVYFKSPFLNKSSEKEKILSSKEYDSLENGNAEYLTSQIVRIY